MATSSKRVLWKGAISFGLVHIPIALHAATQEQSLDFDWLDKRSMDPVGYKRINKKTGVEIDAADIVKGIACADGQYVIVAQEEIAAAYPKTTQTIEIEQFVTADAVPFVYFERPYYIAPVSKSDKVYALLREVLKKTGKVGVARVVIQTKQHLALLVPAGDALVLNLLRWGNEIRSSDDLGLPSGGVDGVGLSAREMQMGEQLVEDMTASWNPEQFTDRFRDQILALVETKVKAGDTASATVLEADEAAGAGATVYDLTELLRRSLDKGGGKTTGGKDVKGTQDHAAKAKEMTPAGEAAPAAGPVAGKAAMKPASKPELKPASKVVSKAAAKPASKVAAKRKVG